MENTQAETTMEITRVESKDISLPLQTLFDECLNFISVNDFNV
jgi:hypothetical protein